MFGIYQKSDVVLRRHQPATEGDTDATPTYVDDHQKARVSFRTVLTTNEAGAIVPAQATIVILSAGQTRPVAGADMLTYNGKDYSIVDVRDKTRGFSAIIGYEVALV